MKKTIVFAAGLFAGLMPIIGGNVQADPNPEAWWARPGPDGVQRIDIRCGSDFIDPAQIVLKARVPVELAVSASADLTAHSFTARLPRPQASVVDVPVGPLQQRIAFVPTFLGDFATACRDDNADGRDPQQKQKQGRVTVIP